MSAAWRHALACVSPARVWPYPLLAAVAVAAGCAARPSLTTAVPQGPHQPELRPLPEEFDPEKAGKLMEVMGKLMASVSELAVTTRITVPGDVIEHNAPKLEGRTAIWEINAENMMTAGASMGSPEIVFSGKGLKFDAPAEAEE